MQHNRMYVWVRLIFSFHEHLYVRHSIKARTYLGITNGEGAFEFEHY